MSKMTFSQKGLRKEVNGLPSGMPITSSLCEQWGVSRQLAHWYGRNGWLKPLGNGYYLRNDDSPTQAGSVSALETNGFQLHIGGKTALALRGYNQYLSLGGQGQLYLYGPSGRKLPPWVEKTFHVEWQVSRLFHEDDSPGRRLAVRRLEPEEPFSPYVSDPERAILEMLDYIPSKQSLEEAREIMEGMFSLNPEKMQLLLNVCTRVKVKRLFWDLSRELELPVAKDLCADSIDFGRSAVYSLRNGKILTKPAQGKKSAE